MALVAAGVVRVALEARRGCRLERRHVLPEHMPYVEAADALVSFGDDSTLQSWRRSSRAPAYAFNNYGFRETRFLPRDFAPAHRGLKESETQEKKPGRHRWMPQWRAGHVGSKQPGAG